MKPFNFRSEIQLDPPVVCEEVEEVPQNEGHRLLGVVLAERRLAPRDPLPDVRLPLLLNEVRFLNILQLFQQSSML